MPLRFDQPKLLGNWEGDPSVIHQALSNMHQSGQRSVDRLREGVGTPQKKPTFKISNAESPFSKDTDEIAKNVNTMLDPSVDDNTKTFLDQKNQYIASKGKSQKNALDQFKTQINEYQQGYGADVWDFTPLTKLQNSAYNDDNQETRGATIQKLAEGVNNPAKMFKPEVYFAKKILGINPQTVKYSDKDEQGRVNTESERSATSRLFVPDTERPEFEYKNGKKTPKLDSSGNPVYELRPPKTVEEILPDVRASFNSDEKVASWATEQAMNNNSSEIEKQVNSWAENETAINNGVPPSKELIEARKQIVARDIAENTVAKNWLALNKPISSSSNTKTLDEPRQATGVQKDAVAAVVDEAVNINTNIGGVEKRKSIYRPNAIVLTNSKPQNYNLSGDVINLDDNSRVKFTGSTNATLSTLYTRMKIGDKNFIFEAEDKDGNKLPPPTHEKIMQTIRNTPIGTKIKSDVHGIMDIVTKDNTKGVMSQEQIARLEELKKWEKLHPESPRIKDNAETAKKRNELYKLRSETQNPNQTVSTEAVNSGNLFRAFGVKTLEEGARSKKLTPEVRQRFSNILEQQKEIEEHNNRVQQKKPATTSNVTIYEHDGKIYNIPKEKESGFLKSFPNAKRK